MKPNYVEINSIAELHRFYKSEKPKHPLVSVIDLEKRNPDRPTEKVFYRTAFYTIMCKKFDGVMNYGRSFYDFDEGSLMFTAPNQIISPSQELHVREGWGVFFHPDLLNGSALARKIHNYSFFNYDAHEALHISDDEKMLLLDCVTKIKREYSQNVDRHTQGLIVDNLQLLLNYCDRFYDRQFLTREKVSHDLVGKFETLLIDFFSKDSLIESGLPDVKYFSSLLNLSPYYLSDLLNKYTGKTTLEHIHLQLIDKAKTLLLGTNDSVSEVAYNLGFEHPSHFTKLFKNRTGLAPKEFRSSLSDNN